MTEEEPQGEAAETPPKGERRKVSSYALEAAEGHAFEGISTGGIDAGFAVGEGRPSHGITPEEIARVPSLPGVYIIKDAAGKTLYIGKAANLRSRVGSYFLRGGDGRFNVMHLLRHAEHVETIVTGNEKEAFLLEDTLIKQEQPRYNIRLRDDKTYVSVKIDMKREWPRAVVLRRRNEKPDGAVYLGPFSSAAGVRDTLRLLQRVFPIRSCPDSVLKNRIRPCLLHEIGRCCAPCVKPVDKKEYEELVQATVLVLKGKTEEVLKKLRADMARLAASMEYEKAAAVRDRIAAIERTGERQLVYKHDGEDRDVLALQRLGGRIAIAVFNYRNGMLVNSRPFVFKDHEQEAADLMEEFISRYYANETPPRELITDTLPAEAEFLAEWLGERREAKCEIIQPQRGDKVKLVEMAQENCRILLEQNLSGKKTLEEIYAEIQDKLQLDEPPEVIECYDNSTIQGYATVGAMVTFREGQPDKSRYRHFKIKTIHGQDDFASMREMLTRRLKRAVEQGDPLPNLILIDGGKGQLGVAEAVFAELGIEGVGLASLAKSKVKRRGDTTERTEERFFLPGRMNPVTFPTNSPALYLLQQVRDEAHRFGITHHRDLRRRQNLRSTLEDLPGVGKTRAAMLLRAFGSVKALRSAPESEIAAVRGIPEKVAKVVYDFLRTETESGAAAELQPPEAIDHEASVEEPSL